MKATMNDRLGRCYELAGRRVLFDEDAAILVHGTIQRDPLPPNPHAWVILPDRLVWEPVTEMTLPADAFARFFGAKEDRRYSPKEVAIQTAQSGHWGPWSSDPS